MKELLIGGWIIVCVSGALGVTPQFIALLALILYLKGERRDRLAVEG